MVFIPKVGKDDYSNPKAYRPITLSNFLLKGLERLVQWHLDETLLTKPLYAQHAYTRGLSTETALSTVVDFVEKALSCKQKCLAVSLDCTGAFDYIQYHSAASAMRRLGVDNALIEWYGNLLKNRKIQADVKGTKACVTPTRGSPQGGVLSPLVWNTIMDTLLTRFKGRAIRAVGYADDVILLISGIDPETMAALMEEALQEVTLWGKANGLTFNPTKTSAMLFHRGRKGTSPRLTMEGHVIPYVPELKYLGITFTPQLRWLAHLKGRVKKAKRVMHLAKASVGLKWGLNPEKVHWVYTAMVRPIVTYGSLVWAHAINKTMRKELQSLQRQALLAITGSMRSTPTDGLEAILGVVPLELYTKNLATNARARTASLVRSDWDGLGRFKGHQRWHDDILPATLRSDRILPTRFWEVRDDKVDHPTICIYTDGSKEEGRVGAGWFGCIQDQVVMESSVGLDRRCTVFQAEVLAILEAMDWLNSTDKPLDGDVCVYSDSQAALQAIRGPLFDSEVTLQCARAIAQAQQHRKVGLKWVRGHNDNTGNEMADYLAKRGNQCRHNPRVKPASISLKSEVKNTYLEEWKKTWKASTSSQSREMFPEANVGKTKHLLRLGRTRLNLLMQVGTGHGLFAYHLAHWTGVSRTCQLCAGGDETPGHLLWDCPALLVERMELDVKLQVSSRNPVRKEKTLVGYFSCPRLEALREKHSRVVLLPRR